MMMKVEVFVVDVCNLVSIMRNKIEISIRSNNMLFFFNHMCFVFAD